MHDQHPVDLLVKLYLKYRCTQRKHGSNICYVVQQAGVKVLWIRPAGQSSGPAHSNISLSAPQVAVRSVLKVFSKF